MINLNLIIIWYDDANKLKDGDKCEPMVYHGHTLTSRIYFKDVIETIEKYAFMVSAYPVILSFENHCSLE